MSPAPAQPAPGSPLASRAERAEIGASLLVICAAIALRLVLAWRPIAVLIAKTLPDDAFYYFQIAHRWAAGQGITFDGLTPTNGFHPLWLLLIRPFFSASAADPKLPIHLSLTLSVALSAATVGFVFLIARAVNGNRLAACAAAVLYAWNPYVGLESLNGLETSIGNLLFAATAWYFLTRGNRLDLRRSLVLGALAGFMVLARTDNVFLLGTILLASVGTEPTLSRLRAAALTGFAAAVVVAPWLVWSTAIAGSPIQTSGLAIPFVLKGNIAPGLGTDSLWRWTAAQTMDGLRLALQYGGAPWTPLPFVLILAAVALAARRGELWLGRAAGRLNFIAAALLLLIVFHSGYRLYPRGWYFVPAALLAAVYLSLVCHYICTAAHRPRLARLGCAAAVAAYIVANGVELHRLWSTGMYPWQSEMLAAARWASEHTAPGSRIGAFNAGIVAYANPERTVVNLDGVVNREAFAAIRERRLWSYIERNGIEYLIDYEPYIRAAPAEFSNTYAPYFGASLDANTALVAKIPGTMAGSDIVILRLRTGS